MKDAGCQSRAGAGFRKRLVQMFGRAGPAAGDDGNAPRRGVGACDLEIVTVLRSVSVHRWEHALAGAELFDAAGPGERLQNRGNAAAVDKHLPDLGPVLADALGVDVDDDALAAE